MGSVLTTSVSYVPILGSLLVASPEIDTKEDSTSAREPKLEEIDPCLDTADIRTLSGSEDLEEDDELVKNISQKKLSNLLNVNNHTQSSTHIHDLKYENRFLQSFQASNRRSIQNVQKIYTQCYNYRKTAIDKVKVLTAPPKKIC